MPLAIISMTLHASTATLIADAAEAAMILRRERAARGDAIYARYYYAIRERLSGAD